MPPAVEIPDGLAWVRAEPRAAAWLAALPDLVAAAADEWDLTLGRPYPDSHVSLVVPATCPSGDAVLKVQLPHHESDHEAAALELWAGDGAVRLLAHDAERHTLLLERCR